MRISPVSHLQPVQAPPHARERLATGEEGPVAPVLAVPYLTRSERDLIYQSTGQRISPGTDPVRAPIPLLALRIVHDQRIGAVSGQDTTSALARIPAPRGYLVDGPVRTAGGGLDVLT